MLSKSSIQKWPAIGSLVGLFFIYCFSPYFAYWFDHTGWNDKRALEAAIYGLASGLVILVPRYRQACLSVFAAQNVVIRYCLPGLLLLGFVSSIKAEYPLRSLQDFGALAGATLTGLCVWTEIQSIGERQLYRGLSLIFLGATLCLFAGFLSYYLVFIQDRANLSLGSAQRWIPHFTNPRFYNNIQIWIIPLASWCLVMLWQERAHKFWVVSVAFGLMFWWTLVFFTLGRGVFLALLVGLIVVLLLQPKRVLPVFVPALLTIVGGGALYAIMFLVVPPLMHDMHVGTGMHYVDQIAIARDSGRLHLWALAFRLIAENPLFGVGAQHYAIHSTDLGSAHNMWLNWGAELGIPSFLLLLLALALIFKKIHHACKAQAASPAVFYIGWQFAAMLLYSCVAGLWLAPLSQTLMACSFALYGVVLTQAGAIRRPAAPHLRPWISYVLLLLLTGVSVAMTFSDLLTMPDQLGSMDQTNYPRFWLNGHFFLQPLN